MSARRNAAAIARLRCAIYTRKSSEEGLEQSFNSLDAQREACEAYIMSQAGEGWTALPAHYDDGGYSGGSMDRPGLKQLLADVALRKVDVVVVYKVDRLTRSLADFAKIVEIFDAHGVSFVSVTQAFNTTTSMGRLTLNVLLSFAQFEREVTGERIRDKIAASKKKGMWMGGTPPLGYRAQARTLVIEDAEAATVRHIFSRYLAVRSVNLLRDELNRDGIKSRPSRESGGAAVPFSRGALYHLLANRLYIGEIVHKEASYPGQHPPIIERELFDDVAAALASNRQQRRQRIVAVSRAPLTGLIFDGEGRPLCPVSSRNGGGRVYRYYVSACLQQGGPKRDNAIRVPAPALEALVLERLQRVSGNTLEWSAARERLVRVEVEATAITILVRPDERAMTRKLLADDPRTALVGESLRIIAPIELRSWAGRVEIVHAGKGVGIGTPRVDRSLIRGLARAHALVRAAKAAPNGRVGEVGRAHGVTESYVRRMSRLAFLAPDIQAAIVEGRQPFGVNLERLMRIDLPLSWSRQRQLLGFADPGDGARNSL